MSPKSSDQSQELRRGSNDPEVGAIPTSASVLPRARRYETRSISAHPADSWIDISPVASSATALPIRNMWDNRLQIAEPVADHLRAVMDHTVSPVSPENAMSAETSSQDEYEESESESDHITTSSTEAVTALSPETPWHGSMESRPELRGPHACFTPQPNAFSHPPLSRSQSSRIEPTPHQLATQNNGSSASNARYASPATTDLANQAQNEAALRASLTTLLSCAAAARGLPKNIQSQHTGDRVSNRVTPGTFRMVRDPVTVAGDSRPHNFQREMSSESQSSAQQIHPRKDKRKSATSSARERHDSKRLKSVGLDELVKPTLLTWLVSAGILVVVSALSFSAGFHAGRESRYFETQPEMANLAKSSSEYGRQDSRGSIGFRKRLWGSVVTAAA